MENLTRQCLPEEGDIVVIQINPVKSVAPLNCRRATYWARGMSTEKYVAIITKSSISRIDTEGRVHDLRFGLIGQGLPSSTRERKDELNEPWMCIPIEPATSHPLDRKPVQTAGGHLPWPDCYYHTAHMQPNAFEADEIHAADSSADVFVPVEETWRVEDIAHADHETYIELLHEQNRLQIRGGTDPDEPVSFGIPESTLDCIASVQPPPGPLKIVVDVWYDLSVVSRVNNPERFYDDVYDLARTEHSAFERWGNVLLEEEEPEEDEDYSDTEYSQGTEDDPEADAPELEPSLCGHKDLLFYFSRFGQLLCSTFLQVFWGFPFR